MIIDKIAIEQFRGFKKLEFDLGSKLTVIAGQNGTQKTTILGMISQPFTITDLDNPMINEKPLSGGTFKSLFSEKFKFSAKFDKPGEHEWTLYFNKDLKIDPYTIESIKRDKSNAIRFWKKGDKSKGSGYVQLPVIYLSLKRLFPIGEDSTLKEDESVSLTKDEFEFYTKWHNKILIITREEDKIKTTNFLKSTNKQTIGANTSYYDWCLNSAGQDNLSKILLAVLSFKRLKDKYPKIYRGGILAIDEIDASFYSGSQTQLVNALIKFASQFQIQIITTSHSLTVLEEVTKKIKEYPASDKQLKIMFLKKVDQKIEIEKNAEFKFIKNLLNVTIENNNKNRRIDVFTEDKETIIFAKALLKGQLKKIHFVDVSIGCDQLIDLASRKVPSFIFPNSLIILDGDVKKNDNKMSKIKKHKNILILPSDKSPEQLFSTYLYNLDDANPVWQSINLTFNHSFCFKDISYEEIQKCRNKAKEWFNSHLAIWGYASKVIEPWKKENTTLVNEFNNAFINIYNKSANKNGMIKK